jgi:hypothetical protein
MTPGCVSPDPIATISQPLKAAEEADGRNLGKEKRRAVPRARALFFIPAAN